MSKIDQVCPVCGEKKGLSYHQWDSRDNKELEIYQCKSCKHSFQPDKIFQDIYTNSSFSELARGNSRRPGSAKIKELDEKAFFRYNFYKRLFQNTRSILEIGSSIGSFVHLLRLNGKEADGIEPDKSYAAFSEEQYFFKQESALFENYNKDKKYDLIVNFHVIEHVQAPVPFVEKIYKLLNRDGRVLIECPSWEIRNYGLKKEALWEPHIHYFTLISIYKLLSKYFIIDRWGFLGSALFISGKKREKIGAEKNPPLKLLFSHVYGNLLRVIFPPVFKKNSKPDILRQLIIQSLANKTRMKDMVRKIFKYVLYKIKEKIYLQKETGNGHINIVHITNFKGWGNNAGDVVLSKCVRDSFNLNGKKKYNIIDLKKSVDEKTINNINHSSALLIGGGGLFLPDTNKNAVSGWQWAVSKNQLSNIIKPLFIYAVGYNYFRGQEPGELFMENLNLVLEKANFIGLRNHGSIEKINELTENKFSQKIKFQPCPTTIISHLHPQYQNKGKETKNVAVNIAFDRYTVRFNKKIYSILDQIALALKKIEAQGYEILNVSHISADERFDVVLDKYNLKYKKIRLQHMMPREIYKFYSNMEIVIGMRGHAQMIPFGVNTPILSLGTHDKMKWFLEDADALEWYIDLNEEAKDISENLHMKFSQIMANKASVMNKIKVKKEKFFDITIENLQYLQQKLDD